MKLVTADRFFLKSKAITKWLYIPILVAGLESCSLSGQINRQAKILLYTDTVISTGHIGISVYEPASKRYWYNYNASKYFTPASNVKLFTLYAGLKYLGDSLVGLRYRQSGDSTLIYPAGDPTLLHPGFLQQPVINWLKNKYPLSYRSQLYSDHLAKGWAWEDYQERYMPQRSELPLYGNMITIYFGQDTVSTNPPGIPVQIDGNMPYNPRMRYRVKRNWETNQLILLPTYLPNELNETIEIPMAASLLTMPALLADTLHRLIPFVENDEVKNNDPALWVVHSRPTDSMLKPMMHNSDNFFAEQTLLMASNEALGFMNAGAIIDSLLDQHLGNIPQRPNWVDGSGLSRYNLFTPQSFAWLLQQLQIEYGIDRLKEILPTGGEGTLNNYFIADSGFIYAKTGTLGGTIALSGFVMTKKNKLLTFSVLTSHFKGSATRVRRSIEKFIIYLRRAF